MWQGFKFCICNRFVGLNPCWEFRAAKQSKYLFSKATPRELLYEREKKTKEKKEGVKGDLFHCKYFRDFLGVVWGLSEPLENSGTVRWANANPSPVAACLSVCRADNVELFYLPLSPLILSPFCLRRVGSCVIYDILFLLFLTHTHFHFSSLISN